MFIVVNVHKFRSYSFGHLESVKWTFLFKSEACLVGLFAVCLWLKYFFCLFLKKNAEIKKEYEDTYDCLFRFLIFFLSLSLSLSLFSISLSLFSISLSFTFLSISLFPFYRLSLSPSLTFFLCLSQFFQSNMMKNALMNHSN